VEVLLVPELLVNIDVDDLEGAEHFYTNGLGLEVARRFDGALELVGAGPPLYLLVKAEGSPPFGSAAAGRSYARHWTPVHLDFVVDDLEAALAQALGAGARAESEIVERAWGRIVLLSDPFGHGFCLLQFAGRGYDELLEVTAAREALEAAASAAEARSAAPAGTREAAATSHPPSALDKDGENRSPANPARSGPALVR
jgi:lactoylglutathione lyase